MNKSIPYSGLRTQPQPGLIIRLAELASGADATESQSMRPEKEKLSCCPARLCEQRNLNVESPPPLPALYYCLPLTKPPQERLSRVLHLWTVSSVLSCNAPIVDALELIMVQHLGQYSTEV